MSRQTHAALLTAMLLLTAIAWGCLADVNAGSLSAPRSSKWPAVRNEHVRLFPACAACGRIEKGNNVHHEIPCEKDGQGDADGDGIINELDPDNLITLCVGETCNCHLWIGHSGSWKTYNPNVREDAKRFREMIRNRKPNE